MRALAIMTCLLHLYLRIVSNAGLNGIVLDVYHFGVLLSAVVAANSCLGKVIAAVVLDIKT